MRKTKKLFTPNNKNMLDQGPLDLDKGHGFLKETNNYKTFINMKNTILYMG